MNYTELFRATLPETALEIAALLVLVVDLGFLRKAALKTRDERIHLLDSQLAATRKRLDEAIAKLKAAGAK